MSANRDKEIAIFNEALEAASPEDRAAYLRRACAGDDTLRRKIEALLQAYAQPDSVLDAPRSIAAVVDQARSALLAANAKRFEFASSTDSQSATEIQPPGMAPDQTESPGTVVGRYKLLQQIGEGGFGVVYMAEQKEPVKRRVALKIIKLGMDTKQVVARFEAERQALAMMDHPNIAKVFDAGMTGQETGDRGQESGGRRQETGGRADRGFLTPDPRFLTPGAGRPYFVMELVKGVSITKFCDENNLSTKERLELFTTVCNAIQHAHQKGIIHRDVKPSNILVTLHDGKPVPKVIDFGIAKATQQELTEKTIFTQFQQMIGTPAYMSPEQAEMSGLDIDTRSDIYSLGVLLYELLTGKTPLDAKILLSGGYDEIRRRIKEEEPPRPSTRVSTMEGEELTTNAKHRNVDPKRFAAELRGDLDWIVMKALEKDRTRRYDSATGFAQDVQRFLENEPIVARPPRQLYRFQKLVRRNKLAFAAAAAIAISLLLGIIVSGWQAVRATRARDEAKVNESKAIQAETVAKAEQKRADQKALEASQNAVESRERLVRLAVANGVRLESEGNFSDALLWFAHALKLDQGDPAKERPHRIRCASVLQHCPNLLQIFQDKSRIEYAEFSPDGTRILTTASGGTARVWDAATGEPITPPLQHIRAEGAQRVVHGSFNPDGTKIVTASFDHTARVWDAQTGKELAVLKHDKWVFYAEFSPDGRLIVTAGIDNRAQVWDAGNYQFKWTLNHTGPVYLARFSASGERIVTCGGDNTARVWNVFTGEAVTPPLPHEKAVINAAFSRDGRHILTGSADWTARVWDSVTGQPVTPPLEHNDLVWQVGFSPTGRQIITASSKELIVWDTTAWNSKRLDLKPYQALSLSGLYSFFSSDGKLFVAPSRAQGARVYDTTTLEPLTVEFPHNATVAHAAFSPDSRRVVTVSDDIARIWEVRTDSRTAQSGMPGSIVNRVPSSPDGRWGAVSSAGGTAQVLDSTSGKPVGPPLKHLRDVLHLRFSPDGTSVVTLGKDRNAKSARLWNAMTGQPLTEPLEYPSGNVFGQLAEVAFSSDGTRIATAFYGAEAYGEVRIWEARSGRLMGNPIKLGAGVTHLSFSPDDRWLVTASVDGMARVWNAETCEPASPPMPHEVNVLCASFSPDSKLILTGCSDGTARIWDAATGEPVTAPLKHDHAVLCAGFGSKDAGIMTATEDGAWSWEIPSDPRPTEDIVLQANVLTGRRIDRSGGQTPLTQDEINSGWQQLKSRNASHPEFASRGGFLPVKLDPAEEAGARFIKNLPFEWRSGVEGSSQHCLDLSKFYNARYTNSLADFPTGRQKLRGVEFDLKGTWVIKLASEGTEEYAMRDTKGKPFPEEIIGVIVARKCRLLHFLHFSDREGEFFGSYLVHFANGQTWEIPLLNYDIINLRKKEQQSVKRSVLAWQGTNKKDPKQIFQTTWKNPLPDSEIESIDFRSAGPAVFMPPMLLAITVE